MPGRDGTGPMGLGAMTGRKFGFGCRRGFARGFGRNCVVDQTSSKTQKQLLLEQKDFLQLRLNIIDNQLENIKQ